VRADGIEGALQTLLRQGVYLTVDEFKGRTPVVRGSAVVTANPDSLRNPLARSHIPARTGGSRSRGTPLIFDLDFVRGCGTNCSLALEAHGGRNWSNADWETPGAGARFRLLKYSSFGEPPARWFTQVDPDEPGLDPVFRLSERAMRFGSSLAGRRLPAPEYVPLDDPIPIARWMRESLRAGRTPHLFTFVSSAVRLAGAARESGYDLTGAMITVAGEPVTRTRLDAIAASGARALPRYGSMECGPIGYGCISPHAPDDVHLQHDLHALIQAGEGHPLLPSDGLLITSLHSASPFTLLNVSMGDRATISSRTCDCPMHQLGFSTHLHDIRSFEKLTAGGMTFLDGDVVVVLERTLPDRFGGTPTHYQLLEDEGSGGEPRLRLLVHPSIGEVDRAAVENVFLDAIGSLSPVHRTMESLWRSAGFFTVERRAPLVTAAGKILHVHSQRPAAGKTGYSA
jgi:hypothetical protein